MLSRESIVHASSGGPMADVRLMERRAPTSRSRVVVERRRSTIATTDGCQQRERRSPRQPRASWCGDGDKVRACAAAQVTGAARDERSVAAVTHCQFVVGWGGG